MIHNNKLNTDDWVQILIIHHNHKAIKIYFIITDILFGKTIFLAYYMRKLFSVTSEFAFKLLWLQFVQGFFGWVMQKQSSSLLSLVHRYFNYFIAHYVRCFYTTVFVSVFSLSNAGQLSEDKYLWVEQNFHSKFVRLFPNFEPI